MRVSGLGGNSARWKQLTTGAMALTFFGFVAATIVTPSSAFAQGAQQPPVVQVNTGNDPVAAYRGLQAQIDAARERTKTAQSIAACLTRLEKEKPNKIQKLNSTGSNCFQLLHS